MGHRQLSNRIRMCCIYHYIDLASIQKTKPQRAEDIVGKAKAWESNISIPPDLTFRNVNIPWAVGNVGDADYIYAFQKVVMPIAYEFNPQLVIGITHQDTLPDLVSAGFDAAAGDPIGGCEVTPAGYAHMTHMLMPLAEGKLVLILEVSFHRNISHNQGGYNLESTAKSALACVKVLMGEPPGPLDPWRLYASEATVRVVNKVINVQSKYWKCCRPEASTIGTLQVEQELISR
jgi:histone deacetylase 6